VARATPWGTIEELRARRLSPGPGTPPEQVAENQRQRLYGAMIVACDEKGYRETTVADLLPLSGVSRKTFYEHFTDKEDCFVETARRTMDFPISLVRKLVEHREPGEERVRETLRALFELFVAQPAAARFCMVESFAAGRRATAVVEAGVEEIYRLGLRALGDLPERGGIDETLARAILGGFHRVIYYRLAYRRAEDLPAAVDPLWKWAMSYQVPPRPLRSRSRQPSFPIRDRMPPFAAYSVEQRIIRGFAAVVVEQGYSKVTVADVCAAASVSLGTFYAHFEGKGDVLGAALDSSGAQMLAATLPTARRAPDWKHAVRAAAGAACGFLASEPTLARLRCVAVYSAGPDAIAQRDLSGVELLRTIIGPVFDNLPDLEPLVIEAIGGAISGIQYDAVTRKGPEALTGVPPLIAYVALSPFIGPDEACGIANGDGLRRSSTS
jgi:AcrR family transcriptional regulator